MKTLIPSFLLACVVVFGSLYGFYRYSLTEKHEAMPTQSARALPAARESQSASIDPCPDGKMLLGECHVRKSGQPDLWIRKTDLNRPKAQTANTVNVASSGITDNERRRVAEFETKMRTEAAEREAGSTQQLAQQGVDRAQCDSIDAEIKSIDAATRSLLSAYEQDRLREHRKSLKDRQFSLRC